MAERRMFAKTIIDSDAFLEMPMSARLLYYDLSMRADDDGFNNSPKKVMRTIGASQDDINILIARKFILPFDNGVIVIKHWRIHNYIRKDTYNETPYKEQKALLELDENNAYRMAGEGDFLSEALPPSTSRRRAVDEPSTQVRLGKDSIDNIPPIVPRGDVDAMFDRFWLAYPRRVGKSAARKAFEKIKPSEELLATILDAVAVQSQSDQWKREGGQYIPHPSTWLNQGRWEDEVQSVASVPARNFLN